MPDQEPSEDDAVPAIWAQPTEYRRGAYAWLRRANTALITANHPLYASLRREQVGASDASGVAGDNNSDAEGRVDDGAHLSSADYRPVRMRYEWTSDKRDVLEFNRDQFITEVSDSADKMGDQFETAMIEFMQETTEAHGQTVKSRPDSDFVDTFIDALEKIQIPFDNDGNPGTLDLVMSESASARLAGQQPTPQQQERLDALLQRKREEWNAARTRRDVPGLSD